MRPAPPRGAVFEQFWLACAEIHEFSGGVLLALGPSPSEWPTCAETVVALDVQSLHVRPGISLPSVFDPVRTSCWFGVGEPAHWPLIIWPRSSTNRYGLPLFVCSSVRSFAMVAPLAL